MFAILTEHWGGKWPLWVSPRQVMVVPIAGECPSVCLASIVGAVAAPRHGGAPCGPADGRVGCFKCVNVVVGGEGWSVRLGRVSSAGGAYSGFNARPRGGPQQKGRDQPSHPPHPSAHPSNVQTSTTTTPTPCGGSCAPPASMLTLIWRIARCRRRRVGARGWGLGGCKRREREKGEELI